MADIRAIRNKTYLEEFQIEGGSIIKTIREIKDNKIGGVEKNNNNINLNKQKTKVNNKKEKKSTNLNYNKIIQ